MENNKLKCGDYFHFVADVCGGMMTNRLTIGGLTFKGGLQSNDL